LPQWGSFRVTSKSLFWGVQHSKPDFGLRANA